MPADQMFITQPPKPIARGRQLRDLTKDAIALFKKKNIDPLAKLVEMVEELEKFEKTAPFADVPEHLQCKRLRMDVLKELVSYATPKLRSVEHTGEINTGITVTLGVAPKQLKTVDIVPERIMIKALGQEEEELAKLEEEEFGEK